MPKKNGTALNQVSPGLSDHRKDRLATFGDQADNPQMDLASMLAQVASKPNSGTPYSIAPEHAGTVAALRNILFHDVMTAIGKPDVRFFERLAAAVRAVTEIRDAGEGSQWGARDAEYYAICEAIRTLKAAGHTRIRVGMIADMLGGDIDEEIIRDRVKRYGIVGLDTRPGRPKGSKKYRE